MGVMDWRVEVGGHVIEASSTLWGSETIKYDGEVKTKGWSLYSASHSFTVTEDGERTKYEVELRQGFPWPRAIFSRNGIVIE